MSSDKSRVKHVAFRREPIASRALRLCALPLPFERDGTSVPLRWAFRDGAITFCAGARTGRALFEAFVRPIDEAYAALPSLHTQVGRGCAPKPACALRAPPFLTHAWCARAQVLYFDKRRFVPQRKSGTQQKRARNTTPAVTHEPGAVLVSNSDEPLPPWAELRANAASRDEALRQLVELIRRTYTVPHGRRLVIDWPGNERDGTLPLVLGGNGSAVGTAEALANSYGEADAAAQFYVRMARREQVGGMPGGHIALYTTDTDFLVLSVLHWAKHNAERAAVQNAAPTESRVYVVLGSTGVLPDGALCAPRTPGALRRFEVYDMHEACAALNGRALAFVVVCTACGNDYVKRVSGLSHESLYRVFCQHAGDAIADRLERALADWLLGSADGAALARYMAWLLRKARGGALLRCSAGASQQEAADELMRHYEEVAWSLHYSLHGTAPPPDAVA